MKTAISLPDDTFHRATKAAAEMGISRSALFARAMEEYLERISGDDLTARINASLALAPYDDSDREVAEFGARTLLALTEGDEW